MNRESKIGNGKDKKLIDSLRKTVKHSGKDLTGLTLFNEDLSGKDFSKSDFTSSDLSGANLSRCNFSSTNLTDTKLTGAHLKGVTFDGTIRDGCQILKYASISVSDKYHYAFLCQDGKGQVILVNEENKPEYVFKQGGASQVGAMLVNLLNTTNA